MTSTAAAAAGLERSVIAAAMAGGAVLAGVAAGRGAQDGAVAGGGFVVGAGAVWVFLVAALWRRRTWNVGDGSGRLQARTTLTAATWITVGRGLLISVVGGFVLTPRPSPSSWSASLPGALYLLAVAGDVLDGALARRTGTTTRLGAALDVTTDATGLLVAPLLGAVWGRLPPWYLLLSVAYPLFKAGLAVRRRRGRPVFPERVRPNRWARRFAATQMGVVATALFPVLPAALTWTAATLAMMPTLVLFAGEWRVATGAATSAIDAQAPAQRPDP